MALAQQVKTYLTRRGFSDKTREHFRIQPATYDNRPCIQYPTLGLKGGTAYRVRFVDGKLPKCKWKGSADQRGEFPYYSAGGLVTAIAEQGGVLHWCSGEPDVWTLYEVDHENATCCFGEGSIPETVVDDLKAFGVKMLILWPDLDDAGMKAAYHMGKRLSGSGIRYEVRVIPGDMGSKRDLNQLLQDIGCAVNRLHEQLNLAVVKTYSDLCALFPEPEPRLDYGASGNGTLPDGLFQEWIETIISALGQPHLYEGRVPRWHCPLPGHADKHPSFTIKDGDTCKMPVCTCGIQKRHDRPADVWDEVARAVHGDCWAEYKTRVKVERGIPVVPVSRVTLSPTMRPKPSTEPPVPEPEPLDIIEAAPPVPPVPEEPLFVSSAEALDAIGNQLAGLDIADVDFVLNPMHVLHGFGGFAHVMFPGKLVYIVGISGGGKTSLAETMGGVLRRDGYDFVWYGPEWSPDEMAMRDIQRGGGVPMIRFAQHRIAVLQEQRGVPSEKQVGEKLPDKIALQNIRLVNALLDWPGKAYYTTPRMNKLPLTQMLASTAAFIDEQRAKGRRIVAFFFDYLQRANKSGRDGAFWSETVAGEIKAFCEDKQLVGVITIQPRKNDSEGVHTGGKTLTEASGQGISDQQCNLYLAIEPIFENEQKTDFARIKVVKNSMGRTGEITVPVDFSRLTWVDREAKTIHLDLREQP